MSYGKTIIQNVYEALTGAQQAVLDIKAAMALLEGKSDSERLAIMLKNFDEQYDQTVWKSNIFPYSPQSGQNTSDHSVGNHTPQICFR